MKMLEYLDDAMKFALEKLDDPSNWESLIVNRRKPHTYRIFTQWEEHDFRICLHRFDPCALEESFFHPHPWAGAFCLLEGEYLMPVGFSNNRECPPRSVCKVKMVPHSRYEIVIPGTWHSVTPLAECFTIMVNAKPWPLEMAHKEVRTTKGKDLDRMSDEDLKTAMEKFRSLLTAELDYSTAT